MATPIDWTISNPLAKFKTCQTAWLLQGAHRRGLRPCAGLPGDRQDQHNRSCCHGDAGTGQIGARERLHQQRGGQHPGQAGQAGRPHPQAGQV